AAGQEKDAGCGSDPSRRAAANGLGRPAERTSACTGARSRTGTFGGGRIGADRDRAPLALALAPFRVRLRSAPALPRLSALPSGPYPSEFPYMKWRKRRPIVRAREPARAAFRTPDQRRTVPTR